MSLKPVIPFIFVIIQPRSSKTLVRIFFPVVPLSANTENPMSSVVKSLSIEAKEDKSSLASSIPHPWGKEAVSMFEKLLTYSNHLGLFSEGIDFITKRLLGNFPQGYSHLALIDAAIVLIDKQMDEQDEIITNLEYGK